MPFTFDSNVHFGSSVLESSLVTTFHKSTLSLGAVGCHRPFHIRSMNAVLLDAIALLAPLLLLFSSSTALVWRISACVAFLQACLIAALYVPVRQAVWEVTETVLVGIGLLLLLPLCAITIFLIAAIAILAVPTLGMAAIMKWSLLICERCG